MLAPGTPETALRLLTAQRLQDPRHLARRRTARHRQPRRRRGERARAARVDAVRRGAEHARRRRSAASRSSARWRPRTARKRSASRSRPSTRSSSSRARRSPPEGPALRERPAVLADIARHSAALEAARVYLHACAAQLWRTAVDGGRRRSTRSRRCGAPACTPPRRPRRPSTRCMPPAASARSTRRARSSVRIATCTRCAAYRRPGDVARGRGPSAGSALRRRIRCTRSDRWPGSAGRWRADLAGALPAREAVEPPHGCPQPQRR